MDSNSKNMIMYEANKKSVGAAYLLLIFSEMLSAHRYYIEKSGSATVILFCTTFGWAFLFAGLPLGAVVILISGIWVLTDIFTLGNQVKEYNLALVKKFTTTDSDKNI